MKNTTKEREVYQIKVFEEKGVFNFKGFFSYSEYENT